MSNEAHEPVTVRAATPRPNTVMAFCADNVFRTADTAGWQGRVRAWAKAVHLPTGATLMLKRCTPKGESATHLSTVKGAY